MSTNTVIVTAQPLTLSGLIAAVPRRWRKVPLLIPNIGEVRHEMIYRVSLHQNTAGDREMHVVLHRHYISK